MKRIYLILLAFAIGSCNSKTSDNAGRHDVGYTPDAPAVSVMKLARTPFRQQIVSNGKVEAVRKVELRFNSEGIVSFVGVRNGQTVKKGDVIASLDRPDLKIAYDMAKTNCEKAELDLYDILAGQGYAKIDTTLIPGNILSIAKMRSGYDNAIYGLALAKYNLETTCLTAPFDGKIEGMCSNSLNSAAGNKAFCTLIDDSSFYVNFKVLESDYPFLKIGEKIQIIPFFNDADGSEGRIVEVNPSVDENGQITARAALKGSGTLLDGMNVRILINHEHGEHLVVPKSALVVRDGTSVLFTYREDGTAHWVYVDVLQTNSTEAVVKANVERGASLSEGDLVIVSGNINLAEGSKVVLCSKN